MIPVLSCRQPWASLNVKGIKTIENRTWKTHYRGDLLIHASGKWDGHANDTYNKIRMNHRNYTDKLVLLPLTQDVSITGHIIGIVNLVGITTYDTRGKIENLATSHLCIPIEDYIWNINNTHGWCFKDAMEFKKPIPAKGKLNLWRPSKEIWNEVTKQLVNRKVAGSWPSK